MGISIFLPTRKNSQRVPNKNTRPFADINGGLLELKLNQLLKVADVDEIVLSSNDERSLEIGESFRKGSSKVRLVERPEFLAASSTRLTDLIRYAGSIIEQEHILWTHVTSPFCEERIYHNAITTYFQQLKEGYDSLFSVNRFQNFLWDREEGDIINRKTKDRWPQTQDLKSLFEINNALFLAPREIFLQKGDRVGKRPYLFEMAKIPSLDIDEMEDFLIAEAVYDHIGK